MKNLIPTRLILGMLFTWLSIVLDEHQDVALLFIIEKRKKMEVLIFVDPSVYDIGTWVFSIFSIVWFDRV